MLVIFLVRQMEQQLAENVDADVIGYRPDDTSESEMSEMDDDESNVDIVTPPSQSTGYRKQNGGSSGGSSAGSSGGSKRAKTSYSGRSSYQ